jgi:hypothetical protein
LQGYRKSGCIGFLRLALELDPEYVEVGVFGIKHAADFDSLTFEAVDKVWPVEMVDVFSVFAGHENQTASEVLDAVLGAGGGRSAHGLGFEHFLVGAGQGVNVQGALAVGNFSVKEARSAGLGIVGLRLNNDRYGYDCSRAEKLR